MSKKRIIGFIACCLILVAGIFAYNQINKDEGTYKTGGILHFDKKETPIELKISCVGDIMIHSTQLPAQYDSATDTYDFSNNFQYVAPYIKEADLALCNLETVFAGGPGYSGYPMFNTPDSLATALKEAGWDVALASNNHILDKGFNGLKRTIEVCRNEGLVVSGTQLPGEKNYAITTAKDVKIGIVSYTYESIKQNGMRSLNGNPIPNEALPCLNTFDYSYIENINEDIKRIKGTIAAAREDGAEIIVCYFHWGLEYKTESDEYQKLIAQEAVAAGADIIFASHPHVIQPMEMIVNSATGKKVPVFYSLGNFISNQRSETINLPGVNSKLTEQGLIGEVDLEYMKSTGEILNINMSSVPVWVEKYWKNNNNFYSVIPLISPEFETNPDLAASGHLNRAQEALSIIKTQIGEENVRGQ